MNAVLKSGCVYLTNPFANHTIIFTTADIDALYKMVHPNTTTIDGKIVDVPSFDSLSEQEKEIVGDIANIIKT